MPKLNLITQPDKLFNGNISVLLINPKTSVKQEFNKKALMFKKDINLYMFEVVDPDEQQDMKWLIEIVNSVDVIILDINGTFKDRWLLGYILNKPNCYLLAFFFIVSSYHMKLGLTVVIEDYIHNDNFKKILSIFISVIVISIISITLLLCLGKNVGV